MPECRTLTIIASMCWAPISIAVGSQLTMSHVGVKKTCSCYNQLPRFSLRSCHGSALLDGSFWPCGLCLLLRVGSASGFPEACPQVLSPSATARQAPWRGKKCAYLWRRASPRARPRDVGSWQQEASVNHGFLMGCFNRTRRRLFFPDVTPRALPARSLHRPATDIFREATQNR